MGLLSAKKKIKKDYDIDSYYLNLASTITNQKIYTKLINNFLKMQDFTYKNWYKEYKINKNGKSVYFILLIIQNLILLLLIFTMISMMNWVI